MKRQDDWNHYAYVYGEGQVARAEFDVQCAIFSNADFPDGLRLIFPSDADEEAIAAVMEPVDGLWVGRLAYGDTTERVVQLADRGDIEPVRAALEALGVRVEITPGWGYFDDRVCPTDADWRRIADRETLERYDLDGDGVLVVLHRFYGGTRGLDAVATRLAMESFETVDVTPERLVLAHEHPLADISRITVGLMRLGQQHGVSYDGWVLPG